MCPALTALAILTGPISFALGVLLGAWVCHCGARGRSPWPQLPRPASKEQNGQATPTPKARL